MATRYYWLKLQDGFFGSKRIKKLRKIAGGDTYTIIYLKMQLLAMKNNGVLEYTGLESTFAEELALDLDEEPENVAVTVNYLLSCGLMETTDNKEFFIPYAVMNTGSETAAAKRVRDHRERKALQCNADVTEVKRIGNAEIEKEIEKEIESIQADEPPVPPAPDKSKSVVRNKYGQYGWVRLSDEEYQRLINDFGEAEVQRCITYVDESAQGNGNKNKWKDWNLVVRRCHREGWGMKSVQRTAHQVAAHPSTQNQRNGADWMLKYMNRPEPKTAKDSQEIRDRADELRQKLKG